MTDTNNQMEQFFTRQNANRGTRLALADPTTGKETEHFLHVLGTNSDAFAAANAQVRKDMLVAAEKAQEAESQGDKAAIIHQAREDGNLKVMASLISDWSFDMPCTEENKMHFLKEAPQIVSTLNVFCARASNFFGKGQDN